MCPLVPRAKNVTTPPTGATAGPADSTPPSLAHPWVNCGSPELGTAEVFSHSALSRPRQATVSVLPAVVLVMTAAGPPRHDVLAGPTACQPAFSDRMYSWLLAPVAMNSGDTGLAPSGLGGAATAGGAMIFPPSECQPPPSCGACTHIAPSVPSTPTALGGGGGVLTVTRCRTVLVVPPVSLAVTA